MAALEVQESNIKNYLIKQVIITYNEDKEKTYNVNIVYTDNNQNIKEVIAEKVGLNHNFIKIMGYGTESIPFLSVINYEMSIKAFGTMYPNLKKEVYKVKDITPCKEMSIEEIEAALGYKITIKKE